MTDIVERLRFGIDWRDYEDTGNTVDWMDEAADEIEKLRKTNERLMTDKLAHMDRIYELYMENEKLKKGE